MLSTEQTSEVPISLVTTRRQEEEEEEETHPMEDKSCHVVLKPTPQRPHGGALGPPDGRPRRVTGFGGIGMGAFTVYVPKTRYVEVTAPRHHLPQPTSWTHVDGADVHHLKVHPPDFENRHAREEKPRFSPDHPPYSIYLPRSIKLESPQYDSDENSDYSEQDKYPIDLRNDSKKFSSALELVPKQEDISFPTRYHSNNAHESLSEEFSLQSRLVIQRDESKREPCVSPADVKNEGVHDHASTAVASPPHGRQESVIMRNSSYQDNVKKSSEGAEYMRYTFRNNNARAEVFEMRRPYAHGDDVVGSFADASERSPETQSFPPYDSDDEEIDVVSDDHLPRSGPTDDDEYLGDRSGEDRSTKDADSDTCEVRALDCKVAAEDQSTSSSPSSSSLSTGQAEASWRSYGLDPQDKEASWGVFSVEDLVLRNRVLVILWSLLGEGRLVEVGYPRAPVHRVLWLTVDVCCSVAGMKSAAAVPLTSDHNCREDMLCFRDHTHRFLEVCAPTRDMWKQFGWAGLTVDAVVRKIYEEELRPKLSKLSADKLPPVIQRALLRLDRLEEMLELPGGGEVKVPLPPVGTATPGVPTPADHRPGGTAAHHQASSGKKKRGRPAKASHKTDPGRIERVMLWRFLLNLLEDPRNKPCIHWVQRDEGIFRILNTDWLARLWGRRHGNPRMTYEKMARAMRTYYRSKVLQPVPRTRNLPRKLIYKFNPAVIHKVSSSKFAPFSDRGLNYNTSSGS